jgi:hypothetical protein
MKSNILHVVHYTDEHGDRRRHWCTTGRQALDLADAVTLGSVTTEHVPRTAREVAAWLNEHLTKEAS